MGLHIAGTMHDRFGEILSAEALEFLEGLHRTFDQRRRDLLAARSHQTFTFSGGTQQAAPQDWKVAPAPPDLLDRRVEITGPTDAKMAINALNSGAKVWLADHEDATTPLWENVIGGQLNLRDALDGTLSYTSAEGKQYALHDGPRPAIVFRPRGWHLTEKHLLCDGERLSGSLTDFGLYFFHCAKRLLRNGSGPYFYLPKLESHLEARLWNDVFTYAQQQLGIAHGTIRATVLIETIPAAFQMDDILFELREHASGLNAGRWDYIFSIIKKTGLLLPDRVSVTMTVPYMRAYTQLLVRTCHRRGAHAIGGMAAFIPSRRDPSINEAAQALVREDKTREAGDGFDGSWVAHPDLVPVCRDIFDGVLGERPHQIDVPLPAIDITEEDLLAVDKGPSQRTEVGLRNAISVGIQYLASWLKGTGAVAIFNLMEDAATAEISRSQVWQWLQHSAVLDDTGAVVTTELIDRIADEEIAKLDGDYTEARALFMEVAATPDFVEFLTLPAYERMP